MDPDHRRPSPARARPLAPGRARAPYGQARAHHRPAAGIAGGQRCLAAWAGLCRTAGEAHLTVSGSAVTLAGWGLPGHSARAGGLLDSGRRYRLCLTTSC